jgi:hypothetical protein
MRKRVSSPDEVIVAGRLLAATIALVVLLSLWFLGK